MEFLLQPPPRGGERSKGERYNAHAFSSSFLFLHLFRRDFLRQFFSLVKEEEGGTKQIALRGQSLFSRERYVSLFLPPPSLYARVHG